MHILLLILKIIGIGILGILGLLLIILALILLIPIVYQVEGDCREHKQVSVRVYDTLHAVSFQFQWTKEYTSTKLRVLWFHLMENEESEDEAEEYSDEELEAALDEYEDFSTDPLEAESSVAPTAITEQMVEAEPSEDAIDIDVDKPKPSRHEESEETSDWKEKVKRIRALLEDEAAMDGLHYILNRSLRFLRRLAPKKLRYDMEFYTGEPDTTGELVGLIATIPWFYKNKKNRLLPDFSQDDPYLYGDAHISGYLQLYRAAGLLLGIYFNSNARRLIQRIRHL